MIISLLIIMITLFPYQPQRHYDKYINIDKIVEQKTLHHNLTFDNVYK